MEEVLAGGTALVGKLFVRADDGVADCTFGLALHGALDVAAPGGEAIDDGTILGGRESIQPRCLWKWWMWMRMRMLRGKEDLRRIG